MANHRPGDGQGVESQHLEADISLLSHMRSLLGNLLHKKELEQHPDDELRAYVHTVEDQIVASGMSADEAHRTALAEFGGLEQMKQAVRDHRSGTAGRLVGIRLELLRAGRRITRKSSPSGNEYDGSHVIRWHPGTLSY
jgi:hypothetical protein